VISSYREDDKPSDCWWAEEYEGFTVHWLVVPYSNKLSYKRRIKAFFRFAWAAGSKACQIGGDIVFASSTPLTIALPGAYASKRLKIPMVFEVRDLWPELPIAVGALKNPFVIAFAKRLERFAYRHSSHIIALSPGMAEGVQSKGYPKDKISIIPNGADKDIFAMAPGSGQAFLTRYPELFAGPLVLYGGTLGVINGVGYLIDIAREMMEFDPSVRFLIVGDGKELAQVSEKAAQEGVLGVNLWIHPPVAKKEMGAVLSAATVATSLFVNLPEMWANSANKFFDSLAAGKPIMINYGGWQASLLEESDAGLVVPAENGAEAAAMLYEFLSDELRLRTAQTAAKKLAETQFDRDLLAAQLTTVLEKVSGCI